MATDTNEMKPISREEFDAVEEFEDEDDEVNNEILNYLYSEAKLHFNETLRNSNIPIFKVFFKFLFKY